MTVPGSRLDLSAPRRVHLVAVGGAAMSGIARYLRQLGHTVSGCDARGAKTVQSLAAEGFEVHVGHDPAHIADVDYVVASTAVRDDNEELVAARAAGIPVLWRGEAMAAIVASRPHVAVVSGTHGKTTTTSMLTAILAHAGRHPSSFIGGTPVGGTGARFDPDGDWIVVEGDESDHSFLDFRRDAALVTNIEADHLDRWGDDVANLHEGFATFVVEATGPVVVCADDAGSAALVDVRPDVVTYGAHVGAHYRMVAYEPTPRGARVGVVHHTLGALEPLDLALRGRDMAANALGAATLAAELGLDWSVIAAALAEFGGVARRFERKATLNGADCYDDYAHTATEVAATLARAKEGPWRNVIAVYQPHRYSRISRHSADFADAFADADTVVVTGLDGAFETPIPGVDGHLVVEAVLNAHPATQLAYLPEWDALAEVPWRYAGPGDIVVTLGCGTITEAHDLWAERDEARR